MEGKLESKISAVIPTYNRCPYDIDKLKYNPPWWASVSLSNQKNIGEIIFVDDGSTDYTEEVIHEINRRLPVEINYLKNEHNMGLPLSRNKGVKSAEYNKIWFMDDDCVIVNERTIPKLDYAFEVLKSKGINVGSISLPVSGSSLESEIVPANEIGKVGKETGIMYACNAKFPQEYLTDLEKNYLDKEKNILNPLEVEFSHAVFLCDKKAFNEVGGFPIIPWKNAHTEEAQFLMRLNKRGYNIFYIPSLDRDFRVFHCRYGDPSFKRIPYDFSVDGISFNQILEESAVGRIGTGCRVSVSEYLHSHVLSEMVTIFKHYGESIGLKNLQNKYEDIAESRFFPEVINGKEIFRSAVAQGMILLEEERLLSNEVKQNLIAKY